MIGHCSICNRKKTLTVSDNTILAEGLEEFFNVLGKKGLNYSKKMAKNVLKPHGRALETEANVGTAFAFQSPTPALSSLLEVINFYHTGTGFYLGNFFWFFAIWMEPKTTTLYLSAPLDNIDLEQRLETKLDDLIIFNISFSDTDETIPYFKDKTHKMKKN